MCPPTLTVGEISAVIIVVFLGVELSVLSIVSGRAVFRPFGPDEQIKAEGREYATRATTLGGLTFAAVALLVGSFSTKLDQLSNVLFLLGLSIGLFLISYSIEVLVRIAKFFWIVQDKTLWYGFISVVVGLALFFQQFVPDVFPLIIVVLITVATIHATEFYYDIRALRPIGRTEALRPNAPIYHQLYSSTNYY